MGTPLDQAFLARDAHDSWQRRLQAANETIWVYTPWLDKMLIQLLVDANLDASAIYVTTDLSPSSGVPDYQQHLYAVKTLLDFGISVRSLEQLNAVALVCDGEKVATGSQVFTEQARNSYAITLFPGNKLGDSDFLHTLQKWFTSAMPIDRGLVDNLLSGLHTFVNAAQNARQDLVDEFDSLVEDYERDALYNKFPLPPEVAESMIPTEGVSRGDQNHLESLSLNSLDQEASNMKAPENGLHDDLIDRNLKNSTKLPPISQQLVRALQGPLKNSTQSSILACLQPANVWGEYESLLVERNSDLTKWQIITSDGNASTTELRRLHMYPLILNPSGRMGFARVGKGRITYVRKSVKWDTPRRVGGRSYKMLVDFPERDLEISNITITLHAVDASSAGVMLHVRFDGVDAVLVTHRELPGNSDPSANFPWLDPTSQASSAELAAELTQPHTFREVIRQAFTPFRYRTLGRQDRNAEEFFPRRWLQVTMFEYRNQPVLVATNASSR